FCPLPVVLSGNTPPQRRGGTKSAGCAPEWKEKTSVEPGEDSGRVHSPFATFVARITIKQGVERSQCTVTASNNPWDVPRRRPEREQTSPPATCPGENRARCARPATAPSDSSAPQLRERGAQRLPQVGDLHDGEPFLVDRIVGPGRHDRGREPQPPRLLEPSRQAADHAHVTGQPHL